MLDSVLPIAIFLGVGYLFKIFYRDISKELVEFIIYFSLPSIVLSKIYPLAIDDRVINLILMFNSFILVNLALAYFVGKYFNLDKKTLATFMIIATFGNTSFIGFSYIDAFYGQDYVVYALIYDLFGSFLLLVSLGIVIIDWGAEKEVSIKSIIKSVVLFPPIIMFFLTIALKYIELPNFVLNTASTLGSTLVPLAMVAIGMKLEIKNIFYKHKVVLAAIGIKMLFIPTIVLIGFLIFFNVDETWAKATILEVAMPPMTMAVVLAIKGGLDERLAINALVVGVILSLVTVTGYYYILEFL